MSDKQDREQEQLLEALLANNLAEFRRLLDHPAVKADYRYGKPHYASCLEIACRRPNLEDFVTVLLAKVKPNINNINPEPIHYAAQYACDKALRVLTKNKKTKVNAVNSVEWTALHYVAKYFTDNCESEERQRFESCVAHLMGRKDTDINRINNKGCTPIHQAALNGNKNAVLAILRHGFREIDLDGYRGIGQTAREVILKKFPEIEGNLPPSRHKGAVSPEPQVKLLAALQDRDLELFHTLLRQLDTDGNAMLDPNHWYGKPLNTTCMEIACLEKGCENFVVALLQAGADPNMSNVNTEKSPIHVATEKGNHEALQVLLKYSTTSVNAVDGEDSTALHYAAHPTSEDVFNQAIECANLLIRHSDINVNMLNKKGLPPIITAVQVNNKAFVELMLDGKSSVDMDQYIDRSTVRDIIIEAFPDLRDIIPVSSKKEDKRPSVTNMLFQYLYKKNTKYFLTELDQAGSNTEILDGSDGTNTYLQYACKHGLKKAAEVLLSKGADPNKTTKKNKIPPVVIACISKHFDIVKGFTCSQSNSSVFKIDAKDPKGNTALHYAAKHEHLETVLALIKHGADITMTNVFNEPALPAKFLESLLNQSIRTDRKYYPADDEYRIILKYDLLVPCLYQDTEHLQTTAEGIHLMEDGKKCSKIVRSEMDTLFRLSKSPQNKQFLKHPIVTTFLTLKWEKVKKFFYINLVLYSLFLFCLNTYVYFDLEVQTDEVNSSTWQTQSSSANCIKLFFKYILILLLFYLGARENIQCIKSPTRYVLDAENYLDLFVILLTCFTLVQWENRSFRQMVRVTTILLSWLELFLMIGRDPRLSSQVHMLKSVTKSYLKFMLWYSILILAFAMSFYIMFGHSNSQHLFNGFFMSLFKSIIMMTGEYELKDSVPVNDLPIVSHLVFVLFVFLVAIVMFNLLTGLAVDDIASLKEGAEILGITSRIRLVWQMERMLLPGPKWCRILLFPEGSLRELYVLPNKGMDILCTSNSDNEDVALIAWKMDANTLCETIRIVGEQNKTMNIEFVKKKLDAIGIHTNELPTEVLELLFSKHDKSISRMQSKGTTSR